MAGGKEVLTGFLTFIRLQLSEAGLPSNNRVMLFLLLTTTAGILIGAAISPNLTVTITVPKIPESFASFIEWMTGILVGGTAVGKAATAYSDARTGKNVVSMNEGTVKPDVLNVEIKGEVK